MQKNEQQNLGKTLQNGKWADNWLLVLNVIDDSSPKFQHRRLLSSPTPMDTPNLQLHTGQFPLKKIQKLAEWLLYIEQTRKYSKWNGRKGWDTFWPSTSVLPQQHVIGREFTTHSFSLRGNWFGPNIKCPKF